MLVGSCIWGTICNYENRMPKVARNAFNIGEVWNPVCCHGNCLAQLAESYCKESNISNTNWLRYDFSSYLIKIWLSVWRHHLANLHTLKTWLSLEQKEIFENSKKHFLLMQATCLCFKMASIEKMQFSS